LLRMIGSTDEHKYLAPAWDLLQRLASAGVIVASNPARANGPRPLLSYRFTGTIAPSPTQWALGSAALALGLPYVADAYADITVRVHAHRGRQESIWQWFCSRQGSNRHKLSCRREDMDLAVTSDEGSVAVPYPWMRTPRPAEPIEYWPIPPFLR
jgi:hypothetical protein